MSETSSLRWLDWAREIQALAQTGSHYAENEYQKERYLRLIEIAAEIMSAYSSVDQERILKLYLSQQGYATPRVDVRGAVFRDDKLLMVRERQDGGCGLRGRQGPVERDDQRLAAPLLRSEPASLPRRHHPPALDYVR